MLKINLAITSDQLEATLKSIDKALDTEAILDEGTALILNRIRTRFLAETAPDGTKWKPSKAGIARRAKGGTGTLFNTGRLFRSIQAYAGIGERAIATDVPYASKNQLGLQGSVSRVFLGFNEEDARLVEKLILLRLNKGLS